MSFITYGKQYIDYKDKKLVKKSLSNDLITTGPFVKKFEHKLKKYLNCKYVYTCNSGTAAIHMALLSIGLKKGDTVLMPAINFISSYNMANVMQLNVFLVDVDSVTGQITPEKIEKCIEINNIKKINALIVMYLGGYPENIKKFYDIKKKYNLYLIEDACHALGAEYKYKKKFLKVGSCVHADVSTFSLHPLKTITTGEGGIVSTNNKAIAENIKLFRSHGIVRNKNNHWQYDVTRFGFNYRLSDINCALGISQLKKINFILKKRKVIYQKYFFALKNFNQTLFIYNYSSDIKPSFHLFLINIYFDKLKSNKEHFMKYLLNHKVIAQQHYIPLYKFSVYKKKSKYYDTEKYFKNSISIPIHLNLSIKKQEKIIKIIKNYLIKFSK